ncbi:hypothetical protein QM480_08470 [Flectobacillus sp. DC10W]|jgi:hypothetical protein|uniref:Uncharacterized protein n=1 Tax=Flectobacillus longus TaxID=2984207 RepID=A0ABT6YLL4_9BACT|nr:hypothetical protein [Flectobacillus longus]MDI9864357.1 hypothetical protein [Flectobacillus longus]
MKTQPTLKHLMLCTLLLLSFSSFSFSGITISKDSTRAWIVQLSSSLPAGSDTTLSKWIRDGLNESILKGTFDTTSNKQKLYSDLNNALSIYHRKVIIRNFDFAGLANGTYQPNGFSQGTQFANFKVKLPNGSFDPDFAVSYAPDVMSFVNNTASLEQLPEGTKLYRVCNDGWDQFTGGYWTRTKPTQISEVIGGTAVQPEWNSFKNIVEYTIPAGGIWVWRGLAAAQKLSNNLNIGQPYLAGGGEQILIPLVYRRLKKADGSFDFRAINPAMQNRITVLPANELPWKR